EIERILNHRQNKETKEDEYYVQWKGLPSTENEWVKTSDFQDLDIIRKYWNAGKRQRKNSHQFRRRLNCRLKLTNCITLPTLLKILLTVLISIN
ncbi:hypothetical protein ROZALSC1DRAFT_18423, partial [Rozella allomycis CSF55]